jgi:hypothetical protein
VKAGPMKDATELGCVGLAIIAAVFVPLAFSVGVMELVVGLVAMFP